VVPPIGRLRLDRFGETHNRASLLFGRRRYGYQRPFMAMNQQPKKNGGKCCYGIILVRFHLILQSDPVSSFARIEWQTAIIFFVVPIREGYTRLITTFDTLSPHPLTPDWILHIINQK
jgi:Pheophorbide a oxygenase